MANVIVSLNSYRRKPAQAGAGNKCEEVISSRRKTAAVRPVANPARAVRLPRNVISLSKMRSTREMRMARELGQREPGLRIGMLVTVLNRFSQYCGCVCRLVRADGDGYWFVQPLGRPGAAVSLHADWLAPRSEAAQCSPNFTLDEYNPAKALWQTLGDIPGGAA